jgi:hypothetical protein
MRWIPKENPPSSDWRQRYYTEALCSGNIGDRENNYKIFVDSTLELLADIDVRMVTAAHAYYYARKFDNVPITNNVADREKYISMYRDQVSEKIALSVWETVQAMAVAVLELAQKKPALRTCDLTDSLYQRIRELPNRFVRTQNVYLDGISLELKMLHIGTQPETVRGNVMTISEVKEKFREFLTYCSETPKDLHDLMDRTSTTALKSYKTYLSIIYQLFSNSEYTTDESWLQFTNKADKRQLEVVSTFPVRTPEAVFGYNFQNEYLQKSLELPIELDSYTDRYLIIVSYLK